MNYYDIHLEYMESSKELKIGLNLDNLILFDEKWKIVRAVREKRLKDSKKDTKISRYIFL